LINIKPASSVAPCTQPAPASVHHGKGIGGWPQHGLIAIAPSGMAALEAEKPLQCSQFPDPPHAGGTPCKIAPLSVSPHQGGFRMNLSRNNGPMHCAAQLSISGIEHDSANSNQQALAGPIPKEHR
jgi:hypothetical protein